MFSAEERSSKDLDFRRKARKLLASKKGGEYRPRLSMRIWLTALFVLVTAIAAITAYEVVRPILEDTLDRASEARFRQVGEQFEGLLEQNDGEVTVEQMQSFASTRGLQWGIVRVEGNTGTRLRGDRDLDWLHGVLKSAVRDQRSRQNIEPIETG